MSKERELLKRVLDGDADRHWTISSRLYKKIEEVLAQPEPLSNVREDLREEISLRDHFAGLAMQGTLSADIEGAWNYYSYLANHAYQIADAMLKERSKRDV